MCTNLTLSAYLLRSFKDILENVMEKFNFYEKFWSIETIIFMEQELLKKSFWYLSQLCYSLGKQNNFYLVEWNSFIRLLVSVKMTWSYYRLVFGKTTSFIHSFIPKWLLGNTSVSKDVIYWLLKMLKPSRCKPKMFGIHKLYHFILLQPIKLVKNEQNMQRY